MIHVDTRLTDEVTADQFQEAYERQREALDRQLEARGIDPSEVEIECSFLADFTSLIHRMAVAHD